MNYCRNIQKNLVAYLTGELDERGREKLEHHLKGCPACRAELEFLRQTVARADRLKPELDRVLASVDWAKTSERIVAAVWDKETSPRTQPKKEKFNLFSLRLRPVLAGLLLGMLIGAVGTWLVSRGGLSARKPAELFFASGEFLDRVDLEIARRETLDYLDKSQFVLLELVQAKAEDGRSRLNEAALQQAKELLSKKKFLNPQLEKVQMAKAKEICDQIELLFYELASLSEGLSEPERQELQNVIEDRSLLLKIRLLKKELQRSEV